MIGRSCLRAVSSLQSMRHVSTITAEQRPSSLPVKSLETKERGAHYETSYRHFTSWLNCEGHAELFEGCCVVGKVVKQVVQSCTLTELLFSYTSQTGST